MRQETGNAIWYGSISSDKGTREESGCDGNEDATIHFATDKKG